MPEGFGDYRTIPNSEPGITYIQAYIPPIFKKVVWRDSILLLENNQHLIENLKEGQDYEIKTEVVEIRPAYTVWKFDEPVVDTIIEEKILIIEETIDEIQPMPQYENETIEERMMVFEADIRYVAIDSKAKDWRGVRPFNY